MNGIRIEEDLLGAREVPADAYYGVHTVRAMENFKISSAKISDVPEMVRGMVMVKKASAMANKQMQTFPADVADGAPTAALVQFVDHSRHRGCKRRGRWLAGSGCGPGKSRSGG